MSRSMTAYGREQIDAPWGNATWELRSVNHRYLDASVRLPEEWRLLETAVRERIASKVKRGKVECSLKFRAAPGQGSELSLDLGAVRQLIRAGAAIEVTFAEENRTPASKLGVNEVLRWPGVIEPDSIDTDTLGKALLETLDKALEGFIAGREREGEKLTGLLLARCDEIVTIVEAIKPMLPEIIAGQRARLLQRLEELDTEFEAGRLEQEMVMFAQKTDVVEELERLETHVAETQRVLNSKGPIGRRLDFLMQELNREANTLGSKSVNTKTTKASVDLKVLIEQMREQIQNLE